MPYPIDFSLATSEQIEAALCARLEHIRLARNMTQAQLARAAGVSLRTLGRLSQGQGISLDTFIRILSALGIQDHLEALLPDPSIRPVERVRHAGTERKRARPRPAPAPDTPWTWGDETEPKP